MTAPLCETWLLFRVTRIPSWHSPRLRMLRNRVRSARKSEALKELDQRFLAFGLWQQIIALVRHKDYGYLLSSAGHQLRTYRSCQTHYLAQSRLGVLKLPFVHIG